MPEWNATFWSFVDGYMYMMYTWNIYTATLTCGRIVICDLRSCNPRSAISIPSILIHPSALSIRRNNATVNDDFPAPVLPTTPIYKYNNRYNYVLVHVVRYRNCLPSRSTWVHFGFCRCSWCSIFCFLCIVYHCLSFFFWLLYCLPVFDLRHQFSLFPLPAFNTVYKDVPSFCFNY